MIKLFIQTFIYRIRFWFFDRYGERSIEKTYIGHGDYIEEVGWTFRGKFYPCERS